MIKLTRLNHQIVAINPDHLVTAEASPDTTLFLLGGDKLIVRESLDELIERVVEFRRAVRTPFEATAGPSEGDLPLLVAKPAHHDGHAKSGAHGTDRPGARAASTPPQER